MRLCPWSLASSIPVLGLERFCPRKGCPWPWPWPRIFFVSLALASSLVSSTPPLLDSTSYFVIGALYRHPGSNALVFCEKLNATLSNLNKSNKKFLILDLNLNTTVCNQHPHANDYLNILSSNAAFPLITKPTRITSISLTLLDHIVTNITQNTLLPGVLKLGQT